MPPKDRPTEASTKKAKKTPAKGVARSAAKGAARSSKPYKCATPDGRSIQGVILTDKLKEKYPCFDRLPSAEQRDLTCWFATFRDAFDRKNSMDMAKIVLMAPNATIRKAKCADGSRMR
jgi:hypothetical protein